MLGDSPHIEESSSDLKVDHDRGSSPNSVAAADDSNNVCPTTPTHNVNKASVEDGIVSPPTQPNDLSEQQTYTTSNTITGLISPLTIINQQHEQSQEQNDKTLLKKISDPTKSKPPQQPINDDITIQQPTTVQVDMAKLQSTRQKAKLSFQKSELLTNEEYIFPRFDILKDITLGKSLGKGGFGTVIEIKDIHVTHEIEQEKDKEIGMVVNRAEKSSIFRIDDYEHEKQKRKRSHSFKLPRRFSSKDDNLKTSNSHDGCEGLSTSTNSRLSKINERETQSERTSSMQQSKSHDCIDDESHPTAGIVMKGSFSSSEEKKSGRRKQRSKNRTRSLSWKAAKEDVSHFFHRPSSNHHRKQHHNDHGVQHAVDVVAEGIHHVEDVVTEGLHHAEDVITDVAERIQEKVSREHHDEDKIGESLHEEEKKGQDDESSTLQRNESEHTSGNDGDKSTPITLERPPRNFSLLAWRDCEAGEEANDALSPEEWKKFNIDYSNISETSVGVSMRRLSDESTADNKKEGDDHTGIASQLSASGARHELIVDPEVYKRQRRLVLFSAPTVASSDDNISNGEEDSERSSTSYHDGWYQDITHVNQHATDHSGDARYVIKIISSDIVENDFKKFLQAARDMATETYFLSVIRHPNILKMRAVGQGDMFSPSFFLVLDRLYDTLTDRIEGTWKAQSDHLENDIIVWGRAHKLKVLWDERMSIMKDLAGALNYLHEMKIIYRDIKPENIGFDSQGIVKLFDFGLATQVNEEDMCANGTYKLTPNTGSIRYMAPENSNSWPYNFQADSYSFGIMLWEVSSLERPFDSYTPKEIRDMVLRWGERPKCKEEWPDRVVKLMTSAWDSNFRKRPTMREIEETLDKWDELKLDNLELTLG